MKILIALAFSSCLLAQTGTVVFTPDVPAVTPVAGSPAIPGHFTATANSITCTITGNAVPATAALITCTLGLTSPATVATYTIPLPSATASYTLSQGLNGDQVTMVLWGPGANPNNKTSTLITFECAATPATGTGSGNITGAF